MFSHGPFIVGIILSYFSIQVSGDQVHIMARDFGYDLA